MICRSHQEEIDAALRERAASRRHPGQLAAPNLANPDNWRCVDCGRPFVSNPGFIEVKVTDRCLACGGDVEPIIM